MKASWPLPRSAGSLHPGERASPAEGRGELDSPWTNRRGPPSSEERRGRAVDWVVLQEASMFKTGPECMFKYRWRKTDLKTCSGRSGNERRLDPCRPWAMQFLAWFVLQCCIPFPHETSLNPDVCGNGFSCVTLARISGLQPTVMADLVNVFNSFLSAHGF